MASKSTYQATEKGAEIEELLDQLEVLLERLRAIYEQYFLGIQKMAPTQLHTEAERRIRDLTQITFKNTALRYRFATLSQKFGSYSTYWKRTMRMIEQGKYVRDLQRVKRQAEQNGEAIPEEILAAMPKLMRERVKRDRAAAVSIAEKREEIRADRAGAPAPAAKPSPSHIHRLDEALVPDDVDVDGLFASLTHEAEAALDRAPIITSRPPPREDLDPPATRQAIRPLAPPLPPRPPPPPAPRRSAPPSVAGTEGAAPRAARPPIPAARPGAPTAPAAAKPAPLGPPPGMSDNDTRNLYQRYLKARELCGESNDGVTYDRLLRTLRSQSSKIMTDHKARGVEFGVVIKDNKVILKAKPKV